MGNKNTNLPKGPEAEATQRDEGELISSATESVSRDESQGPTPQLLASLQFLGENSDYTLLPHSLHQIAEAYSLKQDYQWAIQFLQLEKLYHERLLSNLTVLQQSWESQWREKDSGSSLPSDTDGMSEKHFETLSQMCRTHLRPSVSVEQNKLNTTLADVQTKALQPHHDEETTQEEVKEHSLESEHSSPQTGPEEEDGDTCEEGQEVEEEEEEQCEETPEEEEVKVEWPTGVPQASDKDLAKLSHKEGSACRKKLHMLSSSLFFLGHAHKSYPSSLNETFIIFLLRKPPPMFTGVASHLGCPPCRVC
ncbi:consortin, connexin sorting protein b isoform X3 [Oreochromis aureus]|uniref:Consortin N-terminal domain-containing protein n=1 Tax=Oreochromis aureus TaxID=47969 RepID=A0AAZ1WXQ1_OREAU|nr:consortin, connexin sorting protein b isoform X3 [Oreochromis aureus]